MDKTIRIWETITGAPLHTLTGHTRAVYYLEYSPCGHYIASGSGDDTVRIWNSMAGSIVHVLASSTNSISFSPDGKYLLQDRTILM